MDPEHIIDETALIQRADIEKVYNDCVNWLKKIRAEINEQTHPTYIRANHDRTSPEGTALENLSKIIMINIEKKFNDVMIRIRIESTTYSSHQRRSQYYSLFIVEDLWRIFFVNMNPLMKQLYGNERGMQLSKDLQEELIKWLAFDLIISIFLISLGDSSSKFAGIFCFVFLFVVGWYRHGRDYLRIRGYTSPIFPGR